jgi:hypothetical protein
MATMPEQDERYARARKRVEELKGFYVHLLIYLAVNTGLFLIDLFDGGGWWFFWPLFGWGIGVTAHAVGVFAGEGVFGQEWEARKIREMVERDSRSASPDGKAADQRQERSGPA